MAKGKNNWQIPENKIIKKVKLVLTSYGLTISDEEDKPIFPKDDSLIVLYEGKTYIPNVYELGVPYFTDLSEGSLYGLLLSYQKVDKDYKKHSQLALAFYDEETDFLNSFDDFNTVEGIQESLTSYEEFYNLIRKRKSYYRMTGKDNKEFVVFGNILLNPIGEILRYKFFINSSLDEKVLTHAEYKERMKLTASTRSLAYLPHPNDKCIFCGEKFTLYDVVEKRIRKNPENEHQFFHEKCYLENETKKLE